ncbi:CHAT domain-containing protein [Nocardiopsis rhodophaea]|uniref:CHAT domain-containing protein n=1 Tax=Nocardiopsis rhodophaea TaxID=280238 RepID=A0ABP5EQF9_9ACTN
MADPQHVDVHLPITLIARDPEKARRRAEEMLADTPDPGTRSVALRIMGMAQRESGETARAHRTLRQAAAVAVRAGLDEAAAHARASRLGLLALRGDGGIAGATLGRMAAGTPSTRVPTLVHQGVAAAQRGRFGMAITRFDAALAELGRAADTRMLPGLLTNRGLALMYSGCPAAAAEDLGRALELAEGQSLDCLRGVALQNLGCLATRRGDIATAVARFRAAAGLVPERRRVGLRLDHADALLAAGMFGEARRLLLGICPEGVSADEITTRLLRAKVHLSRDERDAARDQASRVRARCAPDSLWARLADQVMWSALRIPRPRPHPGRPEGPRPRPAGIPRPRPAPPGSGTRTTTPPPGGPGTRATAAPPSAGTALAIARCVSSAPLGPLSPEVLAPRHTSALRAIAAGDHARARRELLRATEDGRPVAPAVRHLELLAHQRTHEREVAAAGARGALGEQDATAALEWVEYGRTLFSAPGRCRDPVWRGMLDRCRAAFARLRAGDDEASAEVRRIASLLGPAQWHSGCVAAGAGSGALGIVDRPSTPTPARGGASGPGASAAPGTFDTAELSERLGRCAFVCFTQPHGVPTAITVVDGRVAAHPLPPLPIIDDAVHRLNGLARMNARTDGSDMGASLSALAAEVERLLFAPISGLPDDRPLVIAPAPFSQALPWGVLPSLRGREVSVVPSGRAWLACRRRARAVDRRAPRVLLAADGELGAAASEIHALHRRFPAADVFTGTDARVGAVLDRLVHADLAHIAAHGLMPAGAPMLSGLALADGPLFAYDLELLASVPALTVLSSCRVGATVASPAGVPIGFGTALLALGGATVVAGVLPVRDQGTPDAMTRFHQAIASGATPARAVADHLADTGFVCFGAG